MSLILNIETSTSVCSVALSRGEEVIDSRESKGERSHATQLTTFISETLSDSGVSPGDLDAIAISKGPGSYTGLRIGVATAKGMAYSLKKPLIAIDTMEGMCYGLKQTMPDLFKENSILFCPMIDARRMEVYMALFRNDLSYELSVRAEIVTVDSFQSILKNQKIVFFGDGMEKCRSTIQHANSIFVQDFYPLARYLAVISNNYFLKNKFEDLAYFEPFYLKDFLATVPRNLLGPKRS